MGYIAELYIHSWIIANIEQVMVRSPISTCAYYLVAKQAKAHMSCNTLRNMLNGCSYDKQGKHLIFT